MLNHVGSCSWIMSLMLTESVIIVSNITVTDSEDGIDSESEVNTCMSLSQTVEFSNSYESRKNTRSFVGTLTRPISLILASTSPHIPVIPSNLTPTVLPKSQTTAAHGFLSHCTCMSLWSGLMAVYVHVRVLSCSVSSLSWVWVYCRGES